MPLQLIRQDLTKISVDAIVNTTNRELVGYSGLDLAIHKAAGPKLDEECSRIAPLQQGKAKITKGYNLPAKYVIHTYGPIWEGGEYGEEEILKSCYLGCLKLARLFKLESIAFPLISSGLYSFPKDKVLKIAMETITDFLFSNDIELSVYLCVYDKESYSISKKLFKDIESFIEEKTDEEYNKFECAEVCYSRRSSEISYEELDISDYIVNIDKSFSEKLFNLIDRKGLTDVECYKKANVDRRVFSKLKNNNYKPSKCTAIAFCIALELDLEEALGLLETLGYTLSKSNKFDLIIRYFIMNEMYDINEINGVLFKYDQMLLGSQGDNK